MREQNSKPSQTTHKSRLLIGVVGIFIALGALILTAGVIYNFPSASNQWYQPEQPIPFSHRKHAGVYKVPCLYCHSAAETSKHATVPALNVCMNCHSIVKPDSPHIQKIRAAWAEGRAIEWVRVHELPDYVNFAHNRHVAAGVSCQKCHGPVEDMDKIEQVSALTMGWCMQCHRGETTPKNVLAWKYPGEKNPHGPVAPTQCNTCHK